MFAVAAASFALLYFRGTASESRTVRSFIRPPENSTYARTSGGASGGHFALAPDGKKLTFAATDFAGVTRLWVRSLNSLQCVPLAGTDEASYPFWSPDSRFIGFFSGGKLRRIDASGGAVSTLCEAPSGGGATWSADGIILFSPSSSEPLSRIPAAGGTPASVTNLDSSRLEHSHRWPWFLPDGRHFLYLARSSSSDIIYVASLDGKENRELLRKHSNVVYGNSCLLFMEEGALIAQPFDPDGLELRGLPATVAEGVSYDPGDGRGEFSASGHGELLYFMSMDSKVTATEVPDSGSGVKGAKPREAVDARARGIKFTRSTTPDNQRLPGVYNPSGTRPADLTLVTGWTADARKP
jgi:hypothetical protein